MWYLIAAVLLLAVPAWADGPVVKQSVCKATWVAPQTNTDGTNLSDLKEYRFYVAPTPTALAVLTTPTAVIPAAELDPPTGRTGLWSCSSLPIGQGYATVTAVDTAGNESPRATPFPFVLADDVSPQAPGSLLLGP